MEKAIRKVCVEMPEEAAQNKKKSASASGMAKKVKKDDVDFLVSTKRCRCCWTNQTQVTDRSTRCIALLLTRSSTRSCYSRGHRLKPLCKKPMETWAQLSRRSWCHRAFRMGPLGAGARGLGGRLWRYLYKSLYSI